MIYTLTLNPSLDYYAYPDSFNIGKTNRTKGEYILPVGKGLNVSVLLSRLGVPTTALGFTGGFTGDELIRLLKEENIHCDFGKANGNTRINVKLCGENITEFNGSGISPRKEDISALKEKVSLLKAGDWLCLSGSIPNGADKDIYLELASLVKNGVKVVVDASGEALTLALSANPFLVKPNIDELGELFGVNISGREEIELYAKKLQETGAQNVLVSLGAEGAFLLDMNGNTHYEAAPKGEAVNTVGAGDSMIAGFICRYRKTENFADSLKYSVAAGSATAFSRRIAEKKLVEELYEKSKA